MDSDAHFLFFCFFAGVLLQIVYAELDSDSEEEEEEEDDDDSGNIFFVEPYT